ncbi:MAG: hypothetical protein PWR24_1553 [Desulfonauticus sp.]|jgi:hypothetical protein|nr:MAG: Uncharacterized protein XD41_0918 [Desulfonauticus sp. 38_4375]MDK2921996.1 hypothetical protein [Desulfonauticus sp.]
MLKGKLGSVSLISVVQMFHQDGKSGMLTIYQDNYVIGKIFFWKGDIVWSKKGNLSGEKAFYQLMNIEEGDFTFDPNVQESERNIEVPCEYLLLEAVRKKDELKEKQQQIINLIKTRIKGVKSINFSFLYREIFKIFNTISGLVDSGEVKYMWLENEKGFIFILPVEGTILEIKFFEKAYPQEVYSLVKQILEEV